MTAVAPLPRVGDVLFDVRGGARTLRISRHPNLWVLSTWDGGRCISTIHLGRSDIAALIAELAHELADGEAAWSRVNLSAPPRAEPVTHRHRIRSALRRPWPHR
jgi:hypothetical protein